MAGTDARKPWDDFKQLRKELELYDPKMLEKPYVVAANKMDMEESQAHLRSFKRRLRGVKVIELAAAFDEGGFPPQGCHASHGRPITSRSVIQPNTKGAGGNKEGETTSVMHACTV